MPVQSLAYVRGVIYACARMPHMRAYHTSIAAAMWRAAHERALSAARAIHVAIIIACISLAVDTKEAACALAVMRRTVQLARLYESQSVKEIDKMLLFSGIYIADTLFRVLTTSQTHASTRLCTYQHITPCSARMKAHVKTRAQRKYKSLTSSVAAELRISVANWNVTEVTAEIRSRARERWREARFHHYCCCCSRCFWRIQCGFQHLRGRCYFHNRSVRN